MATEFWFKFNFKDWADDVKPLSLQSRGLLIELIIHLRRTNGEMIIDVPLISRLTGGLTEQITDCLTEFKTFAIFDFTKNDAGQEILVSRRIKKEIHKSLINSENGRKGGNPNLNSVNQSVGNSVNRKGNRISNSIFNSDYNSYIITLNTVLQKNFKGSDKSFKSFKARISEGRTLADFEKAITNASKDVFHKENGYKYLTPEFFTRADKLDKFIQDVVIKREVLR